MIESDPLIPLLVALLVLQLSPGPDMMLVIGTGIGEGTRAAFFTAVGATLVAGAVQLPFLSLGLASLIQASPLAFDILRLGGAAYLIWVGIRLLLQSRRASSAAPPPTASSASRALREGMISNLTNPKALLFMLAFLPQFVSPEGALPIAVQLLILGALQKLSGFAVLASIAAGAGGLVNWLSHRPHFIVWQRRFTGLVLLLLGVRLLFGGDAGLSATTGS